MVTQMGNGATKHRQVRDSFRASLVVLLQWFQLWPLQELCKMSVLERAPYGEPVKSRSYFLPA